MHAFSANRTFEPTQKSQISLIQQEKTPNERVFPEIFKFFTDFFHLSEKYKPATTR